MYAGCNVYGRHEKRDTRVKPREEWTVVPGMREAVVGGNLFQEVQNFTAPPWLGSGSRQDECRPLPEELSYKALVPAGRHSSRRRGS